MMPSLNFVTPYPWFDTISTFCKVFEHFLVLKSMGSYLEP